MLLKIYYLVKKSLIDYGLTVICLISSVIAVTTMYQYSETNKQVVFSEHMINGLTRLELSLVDAETGQRGFIITNNKQYLDIYKYGLVTYQLELGGLIVLANKYPDVNQQIASLTKLATPKMAELAQTIELRRDSSFEAAQIEVNSHLGKNLMDKFRTSVDVIVKQQSLLLDEFEHRASVAANYATGSLIIGIVALFLTIKPAQSKSKVAARNGID